MKIQVGKKYRTKKHGGVYVVVGISKSNTSEFAEDGTLVVNYKAINSAPNDFPWFKNQKEFEEKFEEVTTPEEDLVESLVGAFSEEGFGNKRRIANVVVSAIKQNKDLILRVLDQPRPNHVACAAASTNAKS